MDIRQLLTVRSMLILYARYRIRNKEDAEDLVQQAYLKTLEDPSSIEVKDAGAFMTWKLKREMRHAKDKLSARQEIVDIAEYVDELVIDDVGEQFANHQQINYLMEVAKLGEREAQALIGVYWYGYSYAEIARIMNVSIHTVHAHLRNAKDKLQIIARSFPYDTAQIV